MKNLNEISCILYLPISHTHLNWELSVQCANCWQSLKAHQAWSNGVKMFWYKLSEHFFIILTASQVWKTFWCIMSTKYYCDFYQMCNFKFLAVYCTRQPRNILVLFNWRRLRGQSPVENCLHAARQSDPLTISAFFRYKCFFFSFSFFGLGEGFPIYP